MGLQTIVENVVEQKLLNLHTCYLAKVISVSKNLTSAKIQPLGMTKAFGESAKAQSPLSNVPIAQSARYKISAKDITYLKDVSTSKSDGYVTSVSESKDTQKVAVLESLEAGDIVVCVCAERNISDAKKGVNSTPPRGHHSMSDSIIIGVL